MKKRLKILSISSISLGVLAAGLSLLTFVISFPFAFFFAILIGFLGLISSTFYIFIDTKYQINTKRFTPGVIGMILSSTPILFMIGIIILSKINS